MELPWPRTLEEFNQYGKGYLFGYLDMVFTKVEEDEVIAQIPLQQHHFGWHGTLHAGTLFALADSCAGYGCVKSLPQGASGFTTIETKNKAAPRRYGTQSCHVLKREKSCVITVAHS